MAPMTIAFDAIGPSIARASHPETGASADLPIAANRNKSPANVASWLGHRAWNIAPKAVDPTAYCIANAPPTNPMSHSAQVA